MAERPKNTSKLLEKSLSLHILQFSNSENLSSPSSTQRAGLAKPVFAFQDFWICLDRAVFLYRPHRKVVLPEDKQVPRQLSPPSPNSANQMKAPIELEAGEGPLEASLRAGAEGARRRPLDVGTGKSSLITRPCQHVFGEVWEQQRGGGQVNSWEESFSSICKGRVDHFFWNPMGRVRERHAGVPQLEHHSWTRQTLLGPPRGYALAERALARARDFAEIERLIL
ncbi:hypothetical protein V8E51_008953 [Hyaloscypha variabilis]